MKIDRLCASVAAVVCLGLLAGRGHAAEGVSPQPSPFDGIDRQIAAQAAWLSTLEKTAREVPSEKTAATGCRTSFSADTIVKGPALGSDLGESFSRNFVMNQACQGILQGTSATCVNWPGLAKVEAGDHGGGPDFRCKQLYSILTRSKVLMTAASDPAGARRLCLGMETETHHDAPISPQDFCDTTVRYADDPHEWMLKMGAFMKQLSPQGADVGLSGAEANERGAMGLEDAAACGQKHAWWEQESCQAARAYRAARAKNDPESCGKSGLCRALMGQKAGSCQAYSDPLRDAYCAHQAASGPDAGKGAAARRDLVTEATKTQVDLMNLSTNIPSGAKDRKVKIAALQERCMLLLKRLSVSVSEPKKAAQSKKRGKKKVEMQPDQQSDQ